jgi:hypothetical protein
VNSRLVKAAQAGRSKFGLLQSILYLTRNYPSDKLADPWLMGPPRRRFSMGWCGGGGGVD